jgi:hypothetical protein
VARRAGGPEGDRDGEDTQPGQLGGLLRVLGGEEDGAALVAQLAHRLRVVVDVVAGHPGGPAGGGGQGGEDVEASTPPG